MRINHIALYVNDLEKMREFYEKYFNAKANKMYHNPKTGLKTYLNSVGYSHVALSVGSQELPEMAITKAALLIRKII